MNDEAHVPAEQPGSQAPARVPRPHGDGGRPQGDRGAPQPRPQETVGLTSFKIGKLTRRAEFLAANGGFRAPTPGFVLLVRERGDSDPAMRLGLTVSKKVGNAVVRNRMKRRFRELARAVLHEAGIAGADHVLIGRQSGIERDFALLSDELRRALSKAANKILPGTGRGTGEAGGGGSEPEADFAEGRRTQSRAPCTTGLASGPPPRSGEDL